MPNIQFILSPESEARQYYTVKFRFPDGKSIKPERVDEYVAAARVLDSLKLALKDGRKAGNIKQIMATAIQFITDNKVKLPTNPDRLQRKLSSYINQGYPYLVHKQSGNQNAAKAKNEALIRQLAARPNNVAKTITQLDYNHVAPQLGLPTLSRKTIYNLAKKSEHQILGQQQGMNAWRNSFDVVVGRERPSSPLLLTVHDGNDWELYYQAPVTKIKNGKPVTETKYHLRKVVVVVIDAFNDYPLGYAIGDVENGALIQQALRNAVLHIADLTGCSSQPSPDNSHPYSYLPWQIKSDNFGLSPINTPPNALRTLYNLVAPHVTPSKVGNSRDKTIESWFDRMNDEFTSGASDARRGLPQRINFAGHNINSLKKNQPNRDFLQKMRAQFPTEAEVVMQIVSDIEADRNNKREDWLNAWNACPPERKRPLTRLHYLETFGQERPRTIAITNKGIDLTHRGEKHNYLMLQHDFIQSIGTDMTILFDEATPQSILAYDKKNNKKYVVPEFQKIPMAYMDMKEGDRARLNQILQFKNEFEQNAIAANAEDMTAIEAESLTKGFFIYGGTNKALLAEAKRALGINSAAKAPSPSEKAGDEDDTPEYEPVYATKGNLKVLPKAKNNF